MILKGFKILMFKMLRFSWRKEFFLFLLCCHLMAKAVINHDPSGAYKNVYARGKKTTEKS